MLLIRRRQRASTRHHDGLNGLMHIEPFPSLTSMSQTPRSFTRSTSNNLSSIPQAGRSTTSNNLSSMSQAVEGKSEATSHAPIVIRHEDSGLRLNWEEDLEPEIVEIPPDYTP